MRVSNSSASGEFVNLIHDNHKVKKRVDERVDEMVAHLVAVQLDEYVSQSLRDDVDKQRRELDSVYVRLYNVYALCTYAFQHNLTTNSEARRQNATVRGGDHSSELLCHLLDKNGAKCGKFPASVSKLMELNGNAVFSALHLSTAESVAPRQGTARTGRVLWRE